MIFCKKRERFQIRKGRLWFLQNSSVGKFTVFWCAPGPDFVAVWVGMGLKRLLQSGEDGGCGPLGCAFASV